MSDISKIMQRIEKMAQDIPRRSTPKKTAPPASPTAPVTPANKGVGDAWKRIKDKRQTGTPTSTSSSLPSVKTMQQAIHGFFDTANGNAEFTSYLMRNYQVPANVSELLKTKIGIDGFWGAETTQDVYGVGWMAKAIVDALNDFGGVAPNSKMAFRADDLKSMKQLLPRSKNPQKEEADGLSEKAEALTKLIEKLTVFYSNYSKQVLESDTFKQLNDKEKVVLNIGAPAPGKFKNYLSDARFLEQPVLSDVSLPGPQNKSVPVKDLSLSWLVNPRYFQNFLQQYLGYSEEESQNKDIQKNVLDTILKQVSSTWKLASPQG
jgi:hypothetical protein